MRARDRTEKALRVVLALCAGCGWLASAVVILEHLEPAAAWPRATACLAWLVFSPLYEGELVALVARLPLVGRSLGRVAWGLEVLPIFLLPVAPAEALVFGSTILAQGHLFLASDDDRNAAYCLAAAPLLAVIALAYAPSAVVLALVPASALTALAGLVLLNGRRCRRRVRRGTPAAEGGAELRGRLLYAAPLGVGSLTLALVAFLAVERALGPEGEGSAGPIRAITPLLPRDQLGGGEGREGNPGPPGGYSPDLPFSGGSLPFSDAPVMRVRPLEDQPPGLTGSSLHLRDMVLDHFDEQGITLADRRLPPERTDRGDGALDGWTWVVDRVPEPDTRNYLVLARALPVPDLGWTLIFAPHPLAAISLERVRYHTDQLLASPAQHDEWFPYALRVVDRHLSARDLRGARARHPSPQYLQLPDRDPALTAVEDVAERWTAGETNDYDRVRAVVNHLLTDFTYDLRSLDFEGTAALSRFLEERRGYCTHFASTAVLMLRTRGISSRVATGFVAHEWSEDDEAWLVRERDAHAWIEVHFAGRGWVTFDPTPAAHGDASSAGLGGEDVDLRPWGERLAEELEHFVESGERGSLAAVLRTLVAGPLELLRRHPALWGALSAAALLLLSGLFERRRRASRAGPGRPDLPRGTLSLYQRLARALAALGYRRRQGQTPREFARAVRRDGGPRFGPLLEATDLYYRARFGGRALDPAEQRFVEGLIQTLR